MRLDNPLFSIIIASKDRAEKLKHCLGAIHPDDMVAFGSELIIVDNGSSDNSLSAISSFKAKADFPVKILKETKPGLSHCRNTGFSHSKGKLIVFTDDDCYLSQDYLRCADKIFQDTNISFATGKVLLHDPSDCPIMTCKEEKRRVIGLKSLAGIPKIIGANMIIRRSVIKNVGPFDPWFGSGSEFAGDDIDYISRALMKGYTGIYEPSLIVYHHHGRRTVDQIRAQEHYYAKGIGALYCKRILNQDASALNALLFAVSKANHFSLYSLSQEEYKEAMLQGARKYLKQVLNLKKSVSKK